MFGYQSNTHPNVFQDQGLLVVPIDDALFPNRCIISNEEVNEADFLVVMDLLPTKVVTRNSFGTKTAKGIATALLGNAGGLAVEFFGKRRLNYYIGLSPDRQITAKRRHRWALGLMIGGPLFGIGMVIGIAITVANMPNAASAESWLNGAAMASFFAGMIALLIGAFLLATASTSHLQVVRSDGQNVWLMGAGPAFLASLPTIPNA